MKEMITILHKQQQILHELLSATTEEQLAIKNRDTDSLRSSCHKKNCLQEQITLIEGERVRLAQNRSLSDLIKETTECRDELQMLQKSLRELIRQLQHLQTVNLFLIKTDLAYWKELKSCLLNNHTPYTANGELVTAGSQQRQLVCLLA